MLKEYLKLLRFVKPYSGLLVLAALFMGGSAVFDGVSLGMIVPLADRVLTNKKIVISAKLPDFAVSLIDRLNSMSPLVVLKGMAIVIVILFLFKGIFYFAQNYLMNKVGQECVKAVRNSLYRKFQDLSLDFYSRKRTGELISRITNDVGFITQAISSGLTDLVYQLMQLMMFTFLAFYIYWKLALFVSIIFPLIVIPVVAIGKKIKRYYVEVQNKMADLNSLLAETIQGAYIVKVFCREDYEYQRFNKINSQYTRYILKGIKRTLMLSPFTELAGAVAAVVVLLIAGKEVINGRLSFGVFGLFLAALLSMIRPFKKLSGVYSINQQAIAASNRIYDILREEPLIRETPGAAEIKEFKHGIVFDKVWFKYSKDNDYVLKDINISVKRGEVIALVGPSGAGKSTIVNLIPRLYDPDRGQICIDGKPIKNFTLKSLRGLISVVSQEMILFNDTVSGNINYGCEEAGSRDIIKAAEQAYACEFIKDLPAGFDTVVGDRGFRLSGGQKQRVVIARAILKHAPILILDEATSHLDSESERMLQKALANLKKGKTVFVIAHRLSTVQNADRIIVVEKGEIVGTGTHSELFVENPTYKKLYELQFNSG